MNHATITPSPHAKVKVTLSGSAADSHDGIKSLRSGCHRSSDQAIAPVTTTRVSKVRSLIGLFSSGEKNSNYGVIAKRENAKCAVPRVLNKLVVSVFFRLEETCSLLFVDVFDV